MKFILYNEKANNGHCKERVKDLREEFKEATFLDVLEFINYKDLFLNLEPEDEIILCGGDGTLNHFINDVKDISINNKVYYVGAGTGNDFLNDIESDPNDLVLINSYLKNLPTVTIDDKELLFINGIGFGLDGYCCLAGDKHRLSSEKPVNYTTIAIKGLLFKYKPCTAKVTVDGIQKIYKRCWIAPTMKGRFYGGGMAVAPKQNRSNEEGIITNVVMYGKGRIHTLLVFPSIFKGEHIRHTEMVDVREGHTVTVEFSRPQALQVDGETFENVSKYMVKINK